MAVAAAGSGRTVHLANGSHHKPRNALRFDRERAQCGSRLELKHRQVHERSRGSSDAIAKPRNASEGKGRTSTSVRSTASSSLRSSSSSSSSGSVSSGEPASSAASPAAAAPAAAAGDRKGKKKHKDQDKKDDIVHFGWCKGMVLHSRFHLTRLLGDGTFGRVLHAVDKQKHRNVAVKVVRDVEKYTRNAKREANILKDVRKADSKGKALCVVMHRTFMHDDRFFCLVFEELGDSLYDFLERNEFRGFWMKDIVKIARQCVMGLAFLHSKMRLSHTDLKLENVLFQSPGPGRPSDFPRQGRADGKERFRGQYMRPRRAAIKLIDFGNATYEHEHHSSVINTRQYRGPEVLLGTGWDENSDLWSLGCCFMEIYTGELLFHTHENTEHLALMERVIEPLPLALLRRATAGVREKHLLPREGVSGDWRVAWPELASSTQAQHVMRSQRSLEELVLPRHRLLATFVRALLAPEASARLGAVDSLSHSFLAARFEE